MYKTVMLSALVFGVFCSSVSRATTSEDGVVVWQKSGCSWYVAETAAGYVLLEWFGGTIPFEGDPISGELHSFGMKDLFVRDATTTTHAWIDNFMLSRASVEEKLSEKCR